MNDGKESFQFAAVVIGRNEGARLKQCLASLSNAALLVYVDSGSSDGSASWASDFGAEVRMLSSELPFTAARARNEGFEVVQAINPAIPFIQFVDGDCELDNGWPGRAITFLESHPKIAAVCGRRRERHPDQTIYNWLCDRDWESPIGMVSAFGGDVMIRADVFQAVGGYRGGLIAGEDPELSVRVRTAGWGIWRIDCEMTLHDAAMSRFGQWWTRTVRSGYANSLGASLHGGLPERHRVWEIRRAWVWGIFIPLLFLAGLLSLGWWALIVPVVYVLQFLRQTVRNRGTVRDRALLALFQMIARFAECLGQMKFLRDRVMARRARLIEYK